MSSAQRLSPQTVTVLTLISEGHSYSQIVDAHPDITYRDIFAAAEEALRFLESESDYNARLAAVKAKHPRAYERWTEAEDVEMETIFHNGGTVAQMSAHFGRQPSAIRSRLAKFGLDPSGPGTRER